jgi:hypothetical protein
MLLLALLKREEGSLLKECRAGNKTLILDIIMTQEG